MASNGPTPLFTPFSITLNAAGAGSANLGSPPMGFNWQAMVTLASQIAGQQVTVTVSASISAYGGQQSGSFSAGSGQQVTVSVIGGTPSSQLTGLMQGTIYPGNQAQPPQLQPLGDLIQISAGVVYIEPGSSPIDVTGSVVVSGGTIDISSGSVTIVEGQGGETPVQMNQPPVSLGNLSFNDTGTSKNFTLPAGTHAIGIAITGEATQLSVTGTTTGIAYFPQPSSLTPVPYEASYYIVPIASAPDSTIQVTVTGLGAIDYTAYVAAILDTQAVQVQNVPQGPIWIAGTVGPLQDSLQTIVLAPQHSIIVNLSLTSTGFQTLVAASSGKSVRLRQFHGATSALGGTGLWQTPSGTSIGQWTTQTGSTLINMDWEGYVCPVGNAFGMDGTTILAGNLVGTLTYDLF